MNKSNNLYMRCGDCGTVGRLTQVSDYYKLCGCDHSIPGNEPVHIFESSTGAKDLVTDIMSIINTDRLLKIMSVENEGFDEEELLQSFELMAVRFIENDEQTVVYGDFILEAENGNLTFRYVPIYGRIDPKSGEYGYDKNERNERKDRTRAYEGILHLQDT